MIYEKLNFKVDIDALVNFYHTTVEPLSPYMQSKAFGGWSIYSENGKYTGAWQTGHLFFKKDENGNTYYDKEAATLAGIPDETAFTQPTEICKGPIIPIMDRIKSLGLEPLRARISVLKANGASSWHKDAAETTYGVRLHIPIITNDQCFFETEGESENLPADGSVYLVRVNRLHRVINKSNQDRIHIIMKITDTQNISQYHRYSEWK